MDCAVAPEALAAAQARISLMSRAMTGRGVKADQVTPLSLPMVHGPN
jgi:hypothetical protein